MRDLEKMNEEAQALRRSHCAKEDRNHDCVGVCTISRAGIQLDCKLCGDLNHEYEQPADQASVRAEAVVEAVGLKWDNLTDEAKAKAVDQINLPWVG